MQDTLKRNKIAGVDHFFHEKGQKWLADAKAGTNGLDALLEDSRQFTQQLLEEIDEGKRILYFEQAADQLLQSCFSTLTKFQEIKIQLWKGNSYETFGAWDKASSAFQCVIVLCDSGEFTAQKAKAHRFIGHIQIRQNRYTEALAAYEESLRLTKDCGDEKGEASSYNGLAFHYLEKGVLDKATSYWQKALKLAVKLNEIKIQANCYNNLGIVANVEGNWEKALAHYDESLQRFKKIEDTRGLAQTYYNIAKIYAKAECWSEASVHYEKSYKLAKEIGDAHTQANIKLNRAELYIAIGDFYLGETLCRQALQMYLQLEDHLGEAEVLKFLGNIYTGKHDWLIAQSYFEESIRLTRKFKGPLYEAEAHFEYGRMWKQKGNNGSARKQYKLALNLFVKVKAQKQVEKVKQEIAEQSSMRMPIDGTTKTVE